jgi:hypothetical protein
MVDVRGTSNSLPMIVSAATRSPAALAVPANRPITGYRK